MLRRNGVEEGDCQGRKKHGNDASDGGCIVFPIPEVIIGVVRAMVPTGRAGQTIGLGPRFRMSLPRLGGILQDNLFSGGRV